MEHQPIIGCVWPDRGGSARVKAAMDISVVIPVYNEVEALPELHHALSEVLDRLRQSAEIVFVDDGSTDGSGAVLDGLAHSDARVQVLHFRRNYGQTAALMAAFQQSTGEVIIPMDGDGQNDPADISRLLDKLAEGFDAVSGWRTPRDDGLARRLPSVVANRLISSLLGVPLHDYGCTMKAYRREVIEDVRLYGEMHRFIPIYAAREGASVTELPVSHHARRHGKSKYGFGRICRVFLDLLALYFIDRSLDRPIQFFGKIGLVFWGVALLTFSWALVLKFGYGLSLIQTPLPLLAATIGLSGILFILLGIMAEVQTRIYFEGRGKPPYKVRNIEKHSTAARATVLASRW
jgi:glycosyltransferase involved in cell wall biosynthesis